MSAAPSINRVSQHGGSAPWADPGWGGAMAFTGPVHLADSRGPDAPPRDAGRLRAALARVLGGGSSGSR